jgi:hypothetical protein
MLSLLASVWNVIVRQVFAGVPAAVRGENNFRRDQAELEKKLGEDIPTTPEISDEAVALQTERESSRRKSLEEKSKSNLTVVSVCSTLAFTGLTFLTGQGIVAGVIARRVLLVWFFLSLAYFGCGAICALKALQITKTWMVNIDDTRQSADVLIGMRLRYLDLNTLETNIKGNWTSVSFTCLRNAVISLLLFAATGIVLIVHPAKAVVPAIALPQTPVPAIYQMLSTPPAKVQCEGHAADRCNCAQPKKQRPEAKHKKDSGM